MTELHYGNVEEFLNKNNFKCYNCSTINKFKIQCSRAVGATCFITCKNCDVLIDACKSGFLFKADGGGMEENQKIQDGGGYTIDQVLQNFRNVEAVRGMGPESIIFDHNKYKEWFFKDFRNRMTTGYHEFYFSSKNRYLFAVGPYIDDNSREKSNYYYKNVFNLNKSTILDNFQKDMLNTRYITEITNHNKKYQKYFNKILNDKKLSSEIKIAMIDSLNSKSLNELYREGKIDKFLKDKLEFEKIKSLSQIQPLQQSISYMNPVSPQFNLSGGGGNPKLKDNEIKELQNQDSRMKIMMKCFLCPFCGKRGTINSNCVKPHTCYFHCVNCKHLISAANGGYFFGGGLENFSNKEESSNIQGGGLFPRDSFLESRIEDVVKKDWISERDSTREQLLNSGESIDPNSEYEFGRTDKSYGQKLWTIMKNFNRQTNNILSGCRCPGCGKKGNIQYINDRYVTSGFTFYYCGVTDNKVNKTFKLGGRKLDGCGSLIAVGPSLSYGRALLYGTRFALYGNLGLSLLSPHFPAAGWLSNEIHKIPGVETLGNFVLTKIDKPIDGYLNSGVHSLGEGVHSLGQSIDSLSSAAGNTLDKGIHTASQGIDNIASGIGDVFKEGANSVSQDVSNIGQSSTAKFADKLSTGIGDGAHTATTAIGNAFTPDPNYVYGGVGLENRLADSSHDIGSGVSNLVQWTGNKIGDDFHTVVGKIGDFAHDTGDKIGNTVHTVGNTIGDTIHTVEDKIGEDFQDVGNISTVFESKLGEGIHDASAGIGQTILENPLTSYSMYGDVVNSDLDGGYIKRTKRGKNKTKKNKTKKKKNKTKKNKTKKNKTKRQKKTKRKKRTSIRKKKKKKNKKISLIL
jgi:hypothetical protein